MLRLVSLAVACTLWVTSVAGEPSRPLVGHVMALLAVFEEADVLPPETSPEANALIHAMIQTQAALTKSTNPATRGWFAEALRSSEAPGAEPDPREGLTSRGSGSAPGASLLRRASANHPRVAGLVLLVRAAWV